MPTGGQKGLIDPEISAKGKKLCKRLEEHRKSIEEVGNLDISDFCCRYLAVDGVWIPLGESLLIERHRPSWDTLHPGRHWAEKCAPSKLSEEQILQSIEKFWEAYDKRPDEK